jgi:hypothetical protein
MIAELQALLIQRPDGAFVTQLREGAVKPSDK